MSRKIQPRTGGTGGESARRSKISEDKTSDTGRPVRPIPPSLAVEERIATATARYIRALAPCVAAARLLDDPIFREQLAKLREAEQRFRNRGVDIRELIDFEVTHPALKDWQTQSNELVENTSGRSDLRRLRRRNVLRFLDGDDISMPIDLPPAVLLPATPWRNAEWRIFKDVDQEEWAEIIFIPCSHPMVKMRPAVDLLSHRQARVILGWPASTLDYWISAAPQLIGGFRQIEIPPAVRETLNAKAEAAGKPIGKPRRTLHRVAFETMSFMIWLASNQN